VCVCVCVAREKEGAAAVAVEVQVLRDRISTVDFVEQEVTRMKTKNVELGRRVKQLERELLEAHEERDFGKEDHAGPGGMTVSEEQVMKLKDELSDLRSTNNRLLKEQQHRGIAAKHAEQRLKMCLQDNLALHQKLNRVEEELNSSRTEVSDLLGQIEHQRDIEEERLQVAYPAFRPVQHLYIFCCGVIDVLSISVTKCVYIVFT
jgi:chromosome condensin MukBEF ATPase and DNA-binding subunit MukB